MVDLSDKGSESEGMSNKSPNRVSSPEGHVKTCVDCGTSKTPLWRGGPAGPKSLCNACGIRSRKKRRALLGLNKDDKKPKKSSSISTAAGNNSQGSSNSSSSSSGSGGNKLGDSLKRKLMEIGRKVVLQRPRSATVGRQRRKMGEEEQAAFLLMALSCGSVSA